MRYVVKYKTEVGVLDKLKDVYKDYTTWYLDNEKGLYKKLVYIKFYLSSFISCDEISLKGIPLPFALNSYDCN